MPGTREQSLVNQEILLGFRNLYNGVLADVDSFTSIQILNQNAVVVHTINPAAIQRLETGVYQALAPASIFTTPGTYQDSWKYTAVALGLLVTTTFNINVYVVPPAPQANFGPGGVLDCTLSELDACMLKSRYLWPVWSVIANGYYLPDFILQSHIDSAISWARRQLGIPLTHVRVRTQPFGSNMGATPVFGTDYEEEGRLIQWDAVDSMVWSSIRLPHTGILKVHSLRGVYGGRVVYNIPQSWVDRNELSQGHLRIRPTTVGAITSLISNDGQFLDVSLLEATGSNIVPGFWAVDYDYGQEGGRIAKEICDLIMKKSAVLLLDQIGMAISRGLSGRSAGVDGLSSSINYVANAEKSMFGALATRYEQDLNPENIMEMRRYYKGISVFIG